MAIILPYLLTFLIAALASWLIVWGVRWYSRRGQLLDIPNERSSHTRPTPRGGGLGIVIVTIVGMVGFFGFDPTIIAYVVAGALIAVVSWLDDVRSLSNRVRFGVHLLAAAIVVVAGGWVEQVQLPFVGTLAIGWLGIPLTLFWLVGMTNIYNFMDGIDGIAGGQALVAGVGWFALGWLANAGSISFLGLFVAASSLGFLLHNWSPAKIFMGDVGSAFLGFTFGWLGIAATQNNPAFALPALLVVWLFLFDAGYTILRRIQRRENIFTAHRTHFYQRMVIAGQSHAPVTLLYMALALVGVIVAWMTFPNQNTCLLAFIPLFALGVWYRTRRLESKPRP
jgi:UDP-N-acetylmuramyl pentapeptide phosphotransferase/UDP-N-acetylglucosamine-1-phosphate transferase